MLQRLALLLPSLALGLPIAALSAGPSERDAMRCRGRLVEVGMTAHSLTERCGAPAYASSLPEWVGSEVQLDRKTTTRTWTRHTVETWAYPGEPGDLLRIVLVRGGLVDAIHLAGRLPKQLGTNCSQGDLPVGTWEGEAALRCGQPAQRTVHVEEKVATDDRGLEVRRVLTHERWVYDPGPGRFIRVLDFVNGRLKAVELAERSVSAR